MKKINMGIFFGTVISLFWLGGMCAAAWMFGIKLEQLKGRKVSSCWCWTFMLTLLIGVFALEFITSMAPKIVWQMKPVFMIVNKIKALSKYPARDMFMLVFYDDRTEDEQELERIKRYGVKKPVTPEELAKEKLEKDRTQKSKDDKKKSDADAKLQLKLDGKMKGGATDQKAAWDVGENERLEA
jgi:hypothetical protein